MRKIIIALSLIAVVNICKAQKIMHAVGATISNFVGYTTSRGTTFQQYITQVYGTYSPRYNLAGKTNSSLSISLPLSVGIGVAEADGGDDFGIAFAYDLPAVLDYNFGFKATPNYTGSKHLGGYAGIGFGYTKISITKSQFSDFTGESYGPLFRAGIRFGKKDDPQWGKKAVEVNFYYKPGLEEAKYKTFGSAVLLDF